MTPVIKYIFNIIQRDKLVMESESFRTIFSAAIIFVLPEKTATVAQDVEERNFQTTVVHKLFAR